MLIMPVKIGCAMGIFDSFFVSLPEDSDTIIGKLKQKIKLLSEPVSFYGFCETYVF